MNHSHRPLFWLLLLGGAIALSGCDWADRVRSFFHREEPGSAAVTIGNRTFTRADLQRFFDNRLSDFRDPEKADKVKSNLLDSFVEEKLLLLQAEQFSVQPNPQLVQAMLATIGASAAKREAPGGSAVRDPALERDVEDSLRVQQYLHDHLLREVAVSDEQCQEYYEGHLREYMTNDIVHVREILTDDRVKAEQILASLKQNKNKNFGDLARVYSKAPSASSGGDLGTFQRGDLPEEFERVVFRLSPTSVSPIVQTKYGYHIFLVEEKILEHQQRFYEVKEQIQEKLRLERERELINKEVEALLKKIPVEIHTASLDFKYIGARLSRRGGAIE